METKLRLITDSARRSRPPPALPDAQTLTPTQVQLIAYFEARIASLEANTQKLERQLGDIQRECPIAGRIRDRNP
jgi:hypothetical protein